jgi:hypothetical protein
MNPYLAFGLAMCAIVALALGLTAYMAVFFNRRAKADMEAAMTPLADLVGGTVDIDEASVSGRHEGHIATGKVVSGPAGAGRFFQATIIDGAGGDPWSWTASLGKQPGAERDLTFDPSGFDHEVALRLALDEITARRLTGPGWFRIEYDPVAGHIQFMRPMRARRDLPSVGAFEQLLDDLVNVGDLNRSLQQGTSES